MRDDDDRNFALTNDEARYGVGELLTRGASSSYRRSSLKSVKPLSAYPKRHGEKWSADEINSVKELFISGSSILDISKIKERTPHSIAWQLHDMKLIALEQRMAVKNGNEVIFYENRIQVNYSVVHAHQSGSHKAENIQKSTIVENPYKLHSEKNSINKKAKIKKKSGFFETVVANFKTYLVVWGVVIAVNQIVIFNACFAPHCLLAALPHTGLIAAAITYFFKDSCMWF
jgi:hypothetical protein